MTYAAIDILFFSINCAAVYIFTIDYQRNDADEDLDLLEY